MVFEKVIVPERSDDDLQGLLKLGTPRGILARIEDRAGQDGGHVIGESFVFQAGLPLDELAFGKGVELVQAVSKLREFSLTEFGGLSAPGPSAAWISEKFLSTWSLRMIPPHASLRASPLIAY